MYPLGINYIHLQLHMGALEPFKQPHLMDYAMCSFSTAQP